MIDLDCMIKSLCLAWLQRIYNVTEGPWKWYLSHLLAKFGGLFLFNCNYDANDLQVLSLFYSQLLTWWSDFREVFTSSKDWHNIIWNNRDIRIDGSPVFLQKFLPLRCGVFEGSPFKLQLVVLISKSANEYNGREGLLG